MKELTSTKNSRRALGVKLVVMAVIGVWALASLALAGCSVPVLEIPAQALQPTPGAGIPRINLEPVFGPKGTPVTVRGEGWNPGTVVFIYLVAPGEREPTSYAVASSVVGPFGGFSTEFMIPSESRWEGHGLVAVIARAADSGAAAQALFSVANPGAQLLETPLATTEPTAMPPSSPQTPEQPTVAATTNLNIRGGPGTDYPVLGVLLAGQSANVTGVSADQGWWQIELVGAAEDRGWVSGRYVNPRNIGNVPVVQSPPPSATATPVGAQGWHAEYFNNRDLSGAPALVRTDATINFDWAAGAPAVNINSDSFSARWSRTAYFPTGAYRFYVHVDDGVRLWIDGSLVVDQWHDSAATTYSADLTLAEGNHSLRMEYFEHTGNALAQLSWELLENYPDWKGEYFNNPSLSGIPVLVRNDVGLNFDWLRGSPGPGVPADDFSARWSRTMHFRAGTYRFKVVVDDGARLWVDNQLIIDRWRTGEPKGYTAEITLTDGFHNFRLEYFEYRYDAQVHLTWERVGSSDDWRGEYYGNRKLEGSPVLVRNDATIDFDWGISSPGSSVPVDDFSARWTRTVDFKGGNYLFRARVDDGLRLWVDDTLVLDSWRDGGARWVEAERQISSGAHRIKVEYYERGGDALIQVAWERSREEVNKPPQAVPGGPYRVEEGSPVSLDGSGSYDPDGSIVRYEWDLSYDGRTFEAEARGKRVETRYPDGPATVTIALRVTDDKGASHMATAEVKVKNVPPTAEAGGPYTGQVGRPISMVGSATDPGAIDQEELIYVWDFGDGTQGAGPTVSHLYAEPNTYTARLTVLDKDGGRDRDTAIVEVTAVN